MDSQPQAGSSVTTSQYHHYIPQFILKNFAHPFQPQQVAKKHKQRGKPKWKKGYRPGDPMLYTIGLAGPEPKIDESPVSRTFGEMDMYRDFGNAPNQHYIEQKLSRLESDAARIIKKIRDDYEAGRRETCLVRSDRDKLRKFLFVMKYRGRNQHRRFYHQEAKDYRANDQEKLQKYMREKGFKKPVDVWFNNIKTLLEMEMDPGQNWMKELRERIYPDDAQWAIAHMQMMYLCICVPGTETDEFILTENAYGIHEGPSSSTVNPVTGEETGAYTEYHVFGPVSQKIMFVLRSFLLPVPEEDADEATKEWRQSMYRLNTEQHEDPSCANSSLEDLPVTKARNSYTTIQDGKRVLKPGEDGTERAYHKFYFKFSPIPTGHVDQINSIMLEQSYRISTIVFGSKTAICRTLESYLTIIPKRNVTYGMKIVTNAPDDARLLCLKKLEQAARMLGSDVAAVYHIDDNVDEQLEHLSQLLERALPGEPTDFMRLYMKLG